MLRIKNYIIWSGFFFGQPIYKRANVTPLQCLHVCIYRYMCLYACSIQNHLCCSAPFVCLHMCTYVARGSRIFIGTGTSVMRSSGTRIRCRCGMYEYSTHAEAFTLTWNNNSAVSSLHTNYLRIFFTINGT